MNNEQYGPHYFLNKIQGLVDQLKTFSNAQMETQDVWIRDAYNELLLALAYTKSEPASKSPDWSEQSKS